ncbi:ParB N-terminal domain-containing protein [Catenovulum sp. 2E275]|uniref:ParB N-terminal domain-containing protein n=1 Tax=Catenovulum sp. 2E275 TaxID=2980497 RepID=UPI0021D02BCB|nr:ParB N-terminal domain-containing protein [Catenovulum sp. 2E275]MCU4675594.1 ParB N-terminal domain-containing protein [Catenovulum sp. 2E275]
MVKKLNLDLLEGKTAKYPSEIKKQEQDLIKEKENIIENGKIQKKLARKTIYGVRIVKKASDTVLWEGNPRNFSRDKDINDLLPLIEKSGGNTQAVDARINSEGKIEVIAGSRRRRCCIESGLELVIDLYENMTDKDAQEIAEIENSGRKQVDAIGECDYLYDKYIKMKELDPTLSVEVYSRMNNMDRTLMHLKFSVAKLPDWIKDSSKNLDWSIRNLKALTSIYRQVIERDINKEDLTFRLPLSTPTLVISAFKKMLDGQTKNNISHIKVTNARDGSVTIKLSKDLSLEKKNKILSLIDNMNEV